MGNCLATKVKLSTFLKAFAVQRLTVCCICAVERLAASSSECFWQCLERLPVPLRFLVSPSLPNSACAICFIDIHSYLVIFHHLSSKQFRQVLLANTSCFIAKWMSGFLCGIILSDRNHNNHHHNQYSEEGRNRSVLYLHFKALYEIFAKISSRYECLNISSIWCNSHRLQLD